jgi:hypothetical protein
MNAVDKYDGVVVEEESMIPVPQQQTKQPQQTDYQEQTVEQVQTEQIGEDIKPVSVEIANKKTILRHVKPQESKYWHFKFIDPRNTNQMTTLLQSLDGYRLTVEYSFKINTADIKLIQNNIETNEIVGKIHLLLCDKRDANLPNKYYCKLFFFHFKNYQLFQAVKAALVNFFENFKPAKKELREGSLTDKGRRVTRRPHRYSLRPRRASLRKGSLRKGSLRKGSLRKGSIRKGSLINRGRSLRNQRKRRSLKRRPA